MSIGLLISDKKIDLMWNRSSYKPNNITDYSLNARHMIWNKSDSDKSGFLNNLMYQTVSHSSTDKTCNFLNNVTTLTEIEIQMS